MLENYLPIGSVILLKDSNKRTMVIGYCPIPQDGSAKVYDYCGCPYPEGIASSEKVLFFNHNDIVKVFYKGFADEEGKELHDAFQAVMKDVDKAKELFCDKNN